MAVIKYKMTINAAGRREVPGYVTDRGHWGNTQGWFIGWADLAGRYYIPSENAIELTKDEFITYCTDSGHTTQPEDWDERNVGEEWEAPNVGAWYDAFVAKNG